MKQNKSVLLIEEDISEQFMMRKIADALDIDIDITTEFAEGYALYQARPGHYGMILLSLDILLSADRNAFRRTQNTEITPPVIALTTEDHTHDIHFWGNHVLQDCIKKPVTPVQMLHLVDRYQLGAVGKSA